MRSPIRLALVAAGTAALLGAATLLASGCSKTSGDAVGAQSQQLVEAGVIVPVASPGNSPSAVVSRRIRVVAYRDIGSSSPSPAGFARGTGTSWTPCNLDDSGIYANCNLGPARLAPGQKHWYPTAPSLVADGRGDVVYVTLGTTPDDDKNGNQASLVVATISSDDGITFGKHPQSTVLVNDNTPGNCVGGIQDLPNATFDFTTEPPTLWVVWRNKKFSSFGACVRRGVLEKHGQSPTTVRWLDAAHTVMGLDKEHMSLTMGQGGVRVQAGDGIVAVAYSNNDEIARCPDSGLTSIRWGMVTSFDDGSTWQTRSSILHTDNFQGCTMSARVQNSLRAFDFLRSPDGNYFFAVNDTKSSIRLFTSESSGVHVSSSESLTWREVCPGTSTFDGVLDAGTAPTSNWTAPGNACPEALFALAVPTSSEFMPALGADGTDRVALSFFRTADDEHVRPMLVTNIGPRSPVISWETTLLGDEMTPNPDASAPASTLLGDTMCVVGASPPSAESCTTSGPFVPFWPFIPRLHVLPEIDTQDVVVQ